MAAEVFITSFFKYNVTLIGMPASGKSTVARLIAAWCGMAYLDVDHRMEQRHGRALNDLVASYGREGFLDLERDEVLALPSDLQRAVLAPGGSVIYREAAMAALRLRSQVVYLSVSLDEIQRRIGSLEARGVVIPPGKTLEDLYQERTHLYAKYAHQTVDAQGPDPETVARRVMAAAGLTGADVSDSATDRSSDGSSG